MVSRAERDSLPQAARRGRAAARVIAVEPLTARGNLKRLVHVIKRG